MERLTYRISSGASNLVGIYEASNPAALRQNGWERLAAYEDILFAPDGTQRITLKRLSEIVTAEQDGRCVVLPCKVERIKDAAQKLYESNGCLYSDIGLSHDYGDCSQGCYQCVVDGLRAEADAALAEKGPV